MRAPDAVVGPDPLFDVMVRRAEGAAPPFVEAPCDQRRKRPRRAETAPAFVRERHLPAKAFAGTTLRPVYDLGAEAGDLAEAGTSPVARTAAAVIRAGGVAASAVTGAMAGVAAGLLPGPLGVAAGVVVCVAGTVAGRLPQGLLWTRRPGLQSGAPMGARSELASGSRDCDRGRCAAGRAG